MLTLPASLVLAPNQTVVIYVPTPLDSPHAAMRTPLKTNNRMKADDGSSFPHSQAGITCLWLALLLSCATQHAAAYVVSVAPHMEPPFHTLRVNKQPPAATLSFYTVIGFHWLPFLRGLHRNLAVNAVMF